MSDAATDPDARYLRIRPSDAPLDPATVRAHVRRLHDLGPAPASGWLDRLTRHPTRPTIECLLATPPGAEAPLTYALGIDDPALRAPFERVCRGLFPDAYEFDWQPAPAARRTVCETPGAAVRYTPHEQRRGDWQTRLTPFEAFCEDATARPRVPLAAIAETMAARPAPLVYQALLRPKPDWSRTAEARRVAIEANQDTLRGQLTNALVGPPEDEARALPAADARRLEELAERNPRRCFDVTARVLAGAHPAGDAAGAVRELATAFGDVSHTCYGVRGQLQIPPEPDLVAAVREAEPLSAGLGPALPGRRGRPEAIVADPSEVGSLCLLDGATLTAAGARALGPTPGERTALPRPPSEHLATYRGAGLLLGHPLTQDGTPDPDPLVLPPALQPLHVAWFGKTGAGKSTSLTRAILANHEATAGADVLIDPKGDGMATDYLRAHYAAHGDLEDVLYFDCAETLPALSFFDIRAELAAGIPRTTAVEDVVDHYVALLRGIMGPERFERAVRSPDVLRYLVKALFDPVNGQDAFPHRELHGAVRRMHERGTAPAVADDDLERMLAGVVTNRQRAFDEIMQGVANRVEKIPVDRRLARVFNHVPGPDDPHFDLADYLDRDVVIVLDTGELRAEAQRVLTLVVLSNLWTALRRRARREDADGAGADTDRGAAVPSRARGEAASPADHGARPGADHGSADRGLAPGEDGAGGAHPLVNLYVEEAASVAASDLLQDLLAQARGFDCAVTLAMQFPKQVQDETTDVYDEVLNNVSTVVTGNVPADRRLAERLATDAMDADAVGNRLRALRRGQWLVSLPAPFDRPEPRPFLVGSAPPPPGDPAGDAPLAPQERTAFERALTAVEERTLEAAGLRLATPSPADEAGDVRDGADDSGVPDRRVDTALPHTKRLPPTVAYEADRHALRCTECGNRYAPASAGLRRAIECCSALDAVDPADVPICDLHLKLSPEERAASDWSDRQLLFLQAVYNAQQLRYAPPEYDLLRDSMLRLQEYVGIDSDAVRDLLDAPVLRHDTDHPHRLYTVTPEGRAVLNEGYREGLDYGHRAGDLEESSQHVRAVEVARRYLETAFLEAPDSPVDEVVPYYDIDDQHRLDVAGLTANGTIHVTVEAERVNNDLAEAAPADFDKMARCEPAHAIWVVMTQAAGHRVLQALNDPPDGAPRVEKTYAETTPPQQFQIDTPGLTAMYPVEWLRDRLADPESG